MKNVKFLKAYPTNEKGKLLEGGYEKGATAGLNDQLANDLAKDKIVEILPKQTNDNIIELLNEINTKLDKVLKK